MTLVLLVLAATALIIAWALTVDGSAVASSLAQDSPVSPPHEQLSPLPTATPAVAPTPVQPTPIPTPWPQSPVAPPAAQPPIPIEILIGVMAAIGLAALVIGLRRR